MLAYLRGVLLEKHPNQVIVDVQGVGYEVAIPVSAYSSLPEPGAEVRLHIPIRPDLRSLNVAMTCAMAVGEALRQIGAKCE